MAWLCQWDIVAGIPSPPKRGCGRLSCGGTGYSYVVHRGGSHAMCVDGCVVHAQNVYDHPIDELCLAISLRMESYGLCELGV